jgi:hypothetical protein
MGLCQKLHHKENSILAIYYLLEKKKRKGPYSYLHDYLAMMPKSFENFPTHFSQQDKDFLKGIDMEILEMLEKEIEEIGEDYELICSKEFSLF